MTDDLTICPPIDDDSGADSERRLHARRSSDRSPARSASSSIDLGLRLLQRQMIMGTRVAALVLSQTTLMMFILWLLSIQIYWLPPRQTYTIVLSIGLGLNLLSMAVLLLSARRGAV